MPVSDKVRALLALRGKRQADLAAHFGMKPQSMNNKIKRDSWSAEDLIKVAEFTGSRVAFVLDDDQKIYLESSDLDDKEAGE